MNKAAKTYVMRFVGSMALYVAMLSLSVFLLRGVDATHWRLLLALLPMIPIGLGLMAFLRFFQSLDELQKQIQLDALAFAFIVTGLLTFAYGLMQNAGLPQVSFVIVFPLMIALWGVGSMIATRRYQ